MVQSVPTHEMPAANVAPLYLYDDKCVDICITYLEKSHEWMDEIQVSPFFQGDIPKKFAPFLSQVPYAGEEESVDQVNVEVRDGFKKEFTDTQQKLFADIEDEFGYGPSAEEWTVNDVLEITNATESDETVRKYVKFFREEIGWATETGSNKHGKKHRLTESRYKNPDAMTDGGGYEWNYNWDDALEKLNEYKLWDDGTIPREEDKYDPKDWFASKNEEHIIEFFEYLQSANQVLVDIYEIRYEYEAEIEDYGLESYLLDREERTEYTRGIRDHVQDLKKHVTDAFEKLSNLAEKAFRSCSSWWMESEATDSNLAKEYLPIEKAGIVEKRINAKRWCLARTHFDPVITGKPEIQADEKTYPNQVYECEKAVRALLRAGWYMKDDILEGADPPVDDASEDSEDESEDVYYDIRTTSKILGLVESALQEVTGGGPFSLKENRAATWDEFVEEFRDFKGEDIPEQQIARYLADFHRKEWKDEGDPVVVWYDEKELHLTRTMYDQIKDNPKHRDWPDRAVPAVPPHDT